MMASSNRSSSWPSMFKSKHNSPNHQWQHDINSSLLSTGFQRTPYASGGAGDERTPEPRPRWNPKPEQICILEAIFNSGMVNPPRDEIRKIRMQLQEYGQVGDANVFYWFQNRKSRSKNKLRKNNNNPEPHQVNNPAPPAPNSSLPQITAPINSSSSSSSEKSSPPDQVINITPSAGLFSSVNNVGSNSPTHSVNQTLFQTHNFQLPLLPAAEAFSFASNNAMVTQQGFQFTDLSNIIQPQPQSEYEQNLSQCLLTNNIMGFGTSKKNQYHQDDDAMMIMPQQYPQHSFCLTSTPSPNVASLVAHIPVSAGFDGGAAAKCTVFINDVALEVPVGPFNVREAFGDEATLFYSTGFPVLTDDWGFTLHPLHHGAYYYLI